MRYTCRAPLRIDFGGGWTDVPIFAEREGGAVLNAAIEMYVRGSLSQPASKGRLHALRGDRSYLRYSLEAPAGAGLGASAAQTVLWAAMIRAAIDNSADRTQIAEIACKIKDALGIVGGKQDEYASALGGVGFYTFTDTVAVERLVLDPAVAGALQRRLVLVYTGARRNSSTIHTAVWDRYRSGDVATVAALRSLKQTAEDMKLALHTSDLDTFGRLLSANWHAQRALHPAVSTPWLDQVLELGTRNGALGGKGCGAGGGGCAVFLARDGAVTSLRAAMAEAGLRLLDVQFDSYGVYLDKG